MARAEIGLSVRAATLTDDSAGSAIPEIARVMTSDSTAPRLAQFVAKFDDGVEEHLFWQFRLPGNFRAIQENEYPRLHVQFYMDQDQADDEKSVCFEGAILAVTPRGQAGGPSGDADVMTALDITADGGGWAAGSAELNHADPATGRRLYQITIDLSANVEGAAAGDYVILGLRRDADNASDTAIGDACVVAVGLEYTVR
jgi:hypothetical protein